MVVKHLRYHRFNHVVPVNRLCVVMSCLEFDVGGNPMKCFQHDSSDEFSMSVSQNIFFPDLPYTVSQYYMTLALMAVRQEVNNFESSVVVQQLEFAMNLALYGLL